MLSGHAFGKDVFLVIPSSWEPVFTALNTASNAVYQRVVRVCMHTLTA